MSVSDPLLKELKGYAQHLVEIKNTINDSNGHVTGFCECLERIFQQGLSCTNYSNSFFRPSESWDWLELMSDNRYGALYAYQSAVKTVKDCFKVRNSRGRSRLLIRTCLVKKCLHVPVQTLMCTSEWKSVFTRQSILGDEILCQILYSVLLWVGRLNFDLDLNNSRFLDDTWVLPITKKLELVPCKKLGVTVVFIQGKAVCYKIIPNSVAAEDDVIEVGDILDELNGQIITTNAQGSLNNIMKKSSGLPVSIYVIKANWHGSLFPPIVPLLIEAGLDPSTIQGKCTQEQIEKACIKNDMAKLMITYIGNTTTGKVGDVKQICGAINTILAGGGVQVDKLVSFECLDLGIKITDNLTSDVLLKNSYMEISSCGCAVNIPYYFAYIAGNCSEYLSGMKVSYLHSRINNNDRRMADIKCSDEQLSGPAIEEKTNRDENCSESEDFTCYVFHCNIQKEIDTILHSIGQGFKRTHYVV